MKKRYKINENQYNWLLNKRKSEIAIANQLIEKLSTKFDNKINEGVIDEQLLDEAITDVISNFAKKFTITAIMAASLLSSGKVNANQLVNAGVDQNVVSKAQQMVSSESKGDISLEKIENKLLKLLKSRKQNKTITDFNNLPQQQKDKLLTYIQSNIDKLSQLKNSDYRITDWLSKNIENTGTYGQVGVKEETITVDTVTANIIKDIGGNFKNNSSQLNNSAKVKNDIQDILNSFTTIHKVTVLVSSDTRRNTGEYENKTWEELNTDRGETIINIMDGMEYNLGGCGVNEKKNISKSIIKLDVNGQNGDGTSGPPSPYETNPEVVDFYNQKGIDAKFWKSQGQGEAYDDISQYDKHRYVKIVVTGEIVEDQTDKIVNYKYLVMKERVKGFKLKRNKQQKNGGRQDVTACPLEKMSN